MTIIAFNVVRADVIIVTYNLYLQLGVDGLRGLANYNPENGVSPYLQELK